MRLLFVLSLLILSGINSAEAQYIGSAYGTFEVTHTKMNFKYQPDTNSYLMTSATTNVKGKSVGVGVLIDLTAPHFDETYKKIIGKELKGKILIRPENIDQKTSLNVEILVNDSIDGYPVKGTTSFSIPIEITKGTWQDYVDGQPIEAVSTDEGTEVYGDAMTSAFTALIATAFAKGYDGNPVEVGPVKVDLNKPIQLSIDRNKITVKELSTDHELTLSLPY